MGLSGAEGTGQHTQGSRAKDRLLSAQAVHPALASRDQGLGPLGSPGQEGSAGVGGQAEGAGAGSWCSLATLAQTGDTGVQGQRAGDPLGPTGQALAFRGAGHPWRLQASPSRCSAQQGGSRGPWLPEPATSPEKGKTQGLASASWLRADLPASAPNIFPKRGAFARLTAGGEGRLCGDWLGSGADL